MPYEAGFCIKDHAILGDNAYEIKGRRPICKKCHKERQRRYDQKKAAERRDRLTPV